MYTYIQKPNHWYIDNLTRVIIILESPLEPASINDTLEVTVMFPEDYEVGCDLYE